MREIVSAPHALFIIAVMRGSVFRRSASGSRIRSTHWAISPFLGPYLKLIAPVSSADAPHVSGFIVGNQCTRGKHFKARSAAHMEL